MNRITTTTTNTRILKGYWAKEMDEKQETIWKRNAKCCPNTAHTHTFEKLERTTKKCNAWNLNKNPTRHANDNCFMAFRMDVRLPSSFLFCLSFFHTFFRVFRYIFSNRLILIKKHCNCSLASILMCVCFKKKTCFQRLVHREKRAIPIFG